MRPGNRSSIGRPNDESLPEAFSEPYKSLESDKEADGLQKGADVVEINRRMSRLCKNCAVLLLKVLSRFPPGFPLVLRMDICMECTQSCRIRATADWAGILLHEWYVKVRTDPHMQTVSFLDGTVPFLLQMWNATTLAAFHENTVNWIF